MSRDAALAAAENSSLSALSLPVALSKVAAEETVAGDPSQGTALLGEIAGVEVGVWELRDGSVTDTEVDEMFVVLSGGAVIEVLTESGATERTHTVRAGDVMRLVAGSRTRWTVSDHIRKVYIAAA